MAPTILIYNRNIFIYTKLRSTWKLIWNYSFWSKNNLYFVNEEKKKIHILSSCKLLNKNAKFKTVNFNKFIVDFIKYLWNYFTAFPIFNLCSNSICAVALFPTNLNCLLKPFLMFLIGKNMHLIGKNMNIHR